MGKQKKERASKPSIRFRIQKCITHTDEKLILQQDSRKNIARGEKEKENNNAHDTQKMRERKEKETKQKNAKLAVVFDLRPKRRVLFGATDKQSIQGGDFHLGCLNTRTFIYHTIFH